MVGVAIQVDHGTKHSWLDSLATFLEQPHHSAPAYGGKDGEVAGIRRHRPTRSGWHVLR